MVLLISGEVRNVTPSFNFPSEHSEHSLLALVQGSTSLVLRQLLCWLFLESFSSCLPLRPRHPGLHLMSNLQIYLPILYYYILRFFFRFCFRCRNQCISYLLFHIFPCMYVMVSLGYLYMQKFRPLHMNVLNSTR